MRDAAGRRLVAVEFGFYFGDKKLVPGPYCTGIEFDEQLRAEQAEGEGANDVQASVASVVA